MPSTRSGASYNPSSSSQKGYRHDYGRSQSVTEGQGDDTSKRSLNGHIQSQPEGLQQLIAAQRVPDPCRSVEKLHEFLPEFKKIPGPSQHLQVTQWMESIHGKEKHDAFNRPNHPSKCQEQPFHHEKAATISEQGQRQSTSHKDLQPGLQNPKYSAGCHGKCISDGQNNDGIAEKGGSQIKISERISDILDGILNSYIAINDVKNHIYDRDSSICNNLKADNLCKVWI
ncbi:hypothetical protein O181_103956 [Austropuccinia psidii MF-1]|uniref:Uncharacterized protein n=1 Tax=Austropuccinia psidii MF-1 TaxID=1389203 RepID=A0A9Q3JLC4_9BASI|nr:hypothetical protein [Austropuccinia psidii MF-1]